MRFFARIRAGSTVDRAWRKHNRVGGEVAGMPFRLEAGPGSPFVSMELAPDQVTVLKEQESVEVESMGVLSTIVDIMKDPSVEDGTRIAAASAILDVALRNEEPAAPAQQQRRRGRG